MNFLRQSITFLAVALLLSVAWQFVKPKPPARVSLDFEASQGEAQGDYRPTYIEYKLANRETEKTLSLLRFVCGRDATEYEAREAGPREMLTGKLKVLMPGPTFNAMDCEPEYKLVQGKPR